MPEREPTSRQRLIIDRELAAARADTSFEVLVNDYPTGHRAARDRFVRVESEKMGKELEKRHLDAIPDVDRRDQQRRHGT